MSLHLNGTSKCNTIAHCTLQAYITSTEILTGCSPKTISMHSWTFPGRFSLINWISQVGVFTNSLSHGGWTKKTSTRVNNPVSAIIGWEEEKQPPLSCFPLWAMFLSLSNIIPAVLINWAFTARCYPTLFALSWCYFPSRPIMKSKYDISYK